MHTVCPLESDPIACLAEKQRLHGDSEERRKRRIRCDYCEFARPNAIIAHQPEEDPDFDTFNFRGLKIDPADFLDDAAKLKTVPKKRKEVMTCKNGHSMKIHGKARADGRRYCRLCDAKTRGLRRQKNRAAKEQAIADYYNNHRGSAA